MVGSKIVMSRDHYFALFLSVIGMAGRINAFIRSGSISRGERSTHKKDMPPPHDARSTTAYYGLT